MSGEPIYIHQGVDYLGFLNAKLRDLRRWATIANELIQDADDAENATRCSIGITEDTLAKQTDGLFEDRMVCPGCGGNGIVDLLPCS